MHEQAEADGATGLFLGGTWRVLPDEKHPEPADAIVTLVEGSHEVTFSDFPGEKYQFEKVEGRWSVNNWQVHNISADKQILTLRNPNLCAVDSPAVWHKTSCEWVRGDWIIEPDQDHPEEVKAHVEIMEDGSLSTTFSDYPNSAYSGGIGDDHKLRINTLRRPNPGVLFVHPTLQTFVAGVHGKSDARWRRATAPPPVGLMHECCICLEGFLEGGGVCCMAQQLHFTCNGCFELHAQHQAGEDQDLLEARDAKVTCPGFRCPSVPFAEQQVALHVSAGVYELHLRAHDRVKEGEVVRDIQAAQAAGDNVDDGDVQQHRRYVVESILTLKCPRCNAAFIDFIGCFALTCATDGAAFCAYCLEDCGDDAHAHVGQCPHNPTGDLFAPLETFHNAQRQRRVRMLQEYLEAIPSNELRGRVIAACDADLRDLGINPDDFNQ